MGIEGMIDSTKGEHLHGEEHVHVSVDFGDPSTGIGEDDHCSHCCHTHTAGMAMSLLKLSCDIEDQQIVFYQSHFLNISQAPPTPPPTA